MVLKSIEIVKKNRVRSGGSIRIRAGVGGVVTRPATSAAAPSPQGPVQARVVESNAEYAVIEVICSCGHKSHIQCNYADAAKSR